jgi:putative flavoprotein involved in K+ transport
VQRTDTVVIGAGQAGLAMSRSLAEQGRDHIVLEAGRVGERWRSQSWDSLRLLTPNWMTRLPDWQYQGPDPEGFMAAGEFVSFLENYAGSFTAPVQDETRVLAVEPAPCGGYMVRTDQGTWQASNVVVATGDCQQANVPAFAGHLDSSVHQATTTTYRNPQTLPDGGVLVVGASASGVQLAHELWRAGREVVLAVGAHARLPRTYRGMDIMWWLDQTGSLDQHIDEVRDPVAAARQPSSQLVGRPPGVRSGGDLDLNTLARAGVRLAGRMVGVDGRRATFADDLAASTAAADERMHRVLDGIDGHAECTGLAPELLAPRRPPRVPVAGAPTQLDLAAAGIATVLWATGYRRSYPWLQVPVLDEHGEINHRHGVTPAPGLYVLGLRFQRRRRSHFIDGVGDDARFVADHIARRALGARSLAA